MLPGDSNTLLVGLGLGWITLALGLFLFLRIRGWWRTRRFGVPINHGVLLVEYGRKLTGVKQHQELVGLLTEAIPHEMCIPRSVLLLPEDHKLSSLGDEDFQLPISHAAVRWVA